MNFSGENALNIDTRRMVDDISQIQNGSPDNQVVWIKDTLDNQTELFGDEGPLHFFRGPVKTTDNSGNGVPGSRRRVFIQHGPVLGTPDDKQRLTIVGLVPPKANIGQSPPDAARKAWINQGHPVTVVKNGEPAISDNKRREIGPAVDIGSNVFLNRGVVVGKQEGRYFLEPGEEMKVGLAGDFSGFDENTEGFETGQVFSEIEIVGRSPADARDLATGDTKFNTIPEPEYRRRHNHLAG